MAVKNGNINEETRRKNAAANEAKRKEEERRRYEEEKRRRIAELQDKINQEQAEIIKLEEEIESYGTMIRKIKQALDEMKSAKGNLSTAIKQLETAYVSDEAEKGKARMKGSEGQIQDKISMLEGTIIPAADLKIQKKKEIVLNKKAIIRKLQNEINSL